MAIYCIDCNKKIGFFEKAYEKSNKFQCHECYLREQNEYKTIEYSDFIDIIMSDKKSAISYQYITMKFIEKYGIEIISKKSDTDKITKLITKRLKLNANSIDLSSIYIGTCSKHGNKNSIIKLILFDHVMCVLNTDKSSNIYTSKNEFDEIKPKINLNAYKDKFIGFISIHENAFIMSKNQIAKVNTYFINHNANVKNMLEQEVDVFLDYYNSIVNKEELSKIIYNSIDLLPKELFLDAKKRSEFIHEVKEFDPICKYYLNNIMLINTNATIFINNYLIELIQDYFQKVSSIIEKYCDFNKHFIHLFILLELENQSKNYFYNNWKSKFEGAITESDLKGSIKDIVKVYFRSDYIQHKDISIIGLFTYFLMYNNMFNDNTNFIVCNQELLETILQVDKELSLEIMEKKLLNRNSSSTLTSLNITDVDLMNGHEFEHFLSELFMKLGYTTSVTRGSGDQGLDVLIEKNGNKIGVQAKCYSKKVTNKAVQEIAAALCHYNCDKGIVVTNNYFTKSALELATSNNIVLWDRSILKQKIDEVF